MSESNLFQIGEFQLHSGILSRWKIECDALTPGDWEAIAEIAHLEGLLPLYREVIGVPTGGLLFAKALEKYRRVDAWNRLIVDDVYTTGTSMREYHTPNSKGLVLFARNKPPSWITPVFQLNQGPF